MGRKKAQQPAPRGDKYVIYLSYFRMADRILSAFVKQNTRNATGSDVLRAALLEYALKHGSDEVRAALNEVFRLEARWKDARNE